MGGSLFFSESETATLELPAALLEQLEKESKRQRKTVARVLTEYLEDLQDARAAEKRMKDIRTGKVEAVPWDDVKRQLLEAH